MKQLSIWNDITTIKQRYLNVLHEMTRIDEHPRRSYQGRNTYKSFTYLKDWTYNIFCVIIETLSIQVRIQNPMVSYFINFNAGNEFQCLKC